MHWVGGAGLALRRAEGRRDCTGRRRLPRTISAPPPGNPVGAVLRRMLPCMDSA